MMNYSIFFFKSNKQILLFFVKEKILQLNISIKDKFKNEKYSKRFNKGYFFPEIKEQSEENNDYYQIQKSDSKEEENHEKSYNDDSDDNLYDSASESSDENNSSSSDKSESDEKLCENFDEFDANFIKFFVFKISIIYFFRDQIFHNAANNNNYKLVELLLNRLKIDITPNMFDYCSKLTQITIPSSVQSIGKYAFYYCLNLKHIDLPSSLKSIDCFAFDRCQSLEQLDLPSSVHYIGENAFYKCTKLKHINIQSSVK